MVDRVTNSNFLVRNDTKFTSRAVVNDRFCRIFFFISVPSLFFCITMIYEWDENFRMKKCLRRQQWRRASLCVHNKREKMDDSAALSSHMGCCGITKKKSYSLRYVFEDFILLTAFKAFLKSGRDFHDQVAGRLRYNLLLPRAQLPRAAESRERESYVFANFPHSSNRPLD